MANTTKELTPAEQFAYQFGYNVGSNGSTFGPSIKSDISNEGYGNSVFNLTTVMNDRQVITLTGILNEMPEFSFGVEYTEGPGKSTQDMLATFFENDLFEIVNAAGADSDENHSFKNLISTGKLSKDMYGGMNASDITLKFRIYSQDTLGQTPVSLWKKYLTNYAVPSSENQFSIQNGVQNIISGLLNAESVGTDLISVFGAKKTQEEIQREKEEAKDNQVKTDDDKILSKNMIAEDIHRDIAKLLNEWETTWKQKIIGGSREIIVPNIANKYIDKITNITLTRNTDDAYLLHPNSTYHYGKLIITYSHENTEYNLWKSDTVAKTLTLSQKLYWSTRRGENDDWDSDCIFSEDGSANESKIDEYLSKWKTQIKQNKFNNESVFDSALDDLKKRLKDFPNRSVQKATPVAESAKEVNKIIKDTQKLVDAVESKVNDIQAIGEQRFSQTRVLNNFNIANSLGEKLWYLTIYKNFLFKKPITVAVKDWEFTNSKEFVNGQPVYTDISITCMLDQTYSIDQWENILK